MILINGVIQKYVDVADRGFQYGDGLFETIEVRDGQPVFLELHLERLKLGCEKLHIPFPGAERLSYELSELCRSQSFANAVLKIMVTRGAGGRGYRLPDTINATRVLSIHPHPDYPKTYQQQGVVARFCTSRLGLNPMLAGIKHLNRLEQVMARAEWYDPAIQEGLMLDVNEHVIEGTMTNLFYVKNNSLYTARLNNSGVAGIIRSIVITLATEQAIPVIEHQFTQEELLLADEIFICNSIIGIWPIREISTMHFSVGPITRKIQGCLNQLIMDNKYA
jgi:4-amino-4-deoxychorismate lyase